MNAYIEKVKDKISSLNGDIIYIHSDVTCGFEVHSRKINQILDEHINALLYVCEDLDVWFPTFNYDFCKTGIYDLDNDKSQIGILSDYFRKNIAKWRSPIPVFNFAGLGTFPELKKEKIIDPFGSNSLFNYLQTNNGLVMFYGTDIGANSLVHYVERLCGNLIYRYDKLFNGYILHNNERESVSLNYLVKPRQFFQEYDCAKVQNDFLAKGILHAINEDSSMIYVARVDELVEYLLEALSLDPFYLLTRETTLKVREIFDKIQRPFLLSDFE